VGQQRHLFDVVALTALGLVDQGMGGPERGGPVCHSRGRQPPRGGAENEPSHHDEQPAPQHLEGVEKAHEEWGAGTTTSAGRTVRSVYGRVGGRNRDSEVRRRGHRSPGGNSADSTYSGAVVGAPRVVACRGTQ